MTRQETISAAQAFTEKHKESHRIHLENGYIEASADELQKMKVSYNRTGIAYLQSDKKFVWAIDQNGVFTTEF